MVDGEARQKQVRAREAVHVAADGKTEVVQHRRREIDDGAARESARGRRCRRRPEENRPARSRAMPFGSGCDSRRATSRFVHGHGRHAEAGDDEQQIVGACCLSQGAADLAVDVRVVAIEHGARAARDPASGRAAPAARPAGTTGPTHPAPRTAPPSAAARTPARAPPRSPHTPDPRALAAAPTRARQPARSPRRSIRARRRSTAAPATRRRLRAPSRRPSSDRRLRRPQPQRRAGRVVEVVADEKAPQNVRRTRQRQVHDAGHDPVVGANVPHRPRAQRRGRQSRSSRMKL